MAAPKNTTTNSKKNQGFLKGVRSEWKKIQWPSAKEVANYTWVVIVISTIMAVFTYGLDNLFRFLLSLVIS